MTQDYIPLIEGGLSTMGVSLDAHKVKQLAQYLALMAQWNQRINLTAITVPEAMVTKHILDSLSLAPFISEGPILDVGTGAGLPGIPLSIMFPDKSFVLLDKLSKRIQFLRHVKQVLGLPNVDLSCERVESLRDFHFPCIVTRAFASIDKLVQVCGNCLQNQGRILAMTGPVDDAVLANIPAQWQVQAPKPLKVPGLESPHYLVILEKNNDKER